MNKASRQLQNKVWDRGRPRLEDTWSGDHEYFLPWESDARAFNPTISLYISTHRGSCVFKEVGFLCIKLM